MAALLLVAVIAMAWLWPEGKLPSVAQQGTQVEGVVTAVDEQPCPRLPRPDPTSTPHSRRRRPTGAGPRRSVSAPGPVRARRSRAPLPTGVGAPAIALDDKVVLLHSPTSAPERLRRLSRAARQPPARSHQDAARPRHQRP